MKRAAGVLIGAAGVLAILLSATGPATAELPVDWKAKLEPPDDRWKSVEQVFRFNNGAEPETLDPALTTGVPENRLVGALFEGLVAQHPKTLEPVPGVAERWEISADKKTYTFHLRKNAKWSDGQTVTAHDFWKAWRRTLTPKTASQYSYQFYPISNAEAFNKGLFAPLNKLEIEADTYGWPKKLAAADLKYLGELLQLEPVALCTKVGLAVEVDASKTGKDRGKKKPTKASAASLKPLVDALKARGLLLGTELLDYPDRATLDAIAAGEKDGFEPVGAKATGDYTFVVRLKQPCPYFLDLAAFETLRPIRVDVVEKYGDKWVRPEHIVSNGAFKLTEWRHSQRLILERNEHYWDKDFVKLDKIIAYPWQDAETSYKQFISGAIDWMTSVPAAKIDEVRYLPSYYVATYLGSYFYRINVTKAPFDDVRVRRAFSIGFDREVVTRDVLKAGQIPAAWFCPEIYPYKPPRGLKYDREKAIALLREAGYKVQGKPANGKPFPDVVLTYNTNESHKQVAEVIVQQWNENLGINVSLQNSEWKVYLNDVTHLQYQIARAGWIGDYGDPNTFLDMWVTGGGNNSTGWSNKRYDDLIAAAAAEGDPKKRMQHFHEAEQIVVEQEHPIIPIYIYVNQGLLAERVGGWFENVRDNHPMKYLYIKPIKRAGRSSFPWGPALIVLALVAGLVWIGVRQKEAADG